MPEETRPDDPSLVDAAGYPYDLDAAAGRLLRLVADKLDVGRVYLHREPPREDQVYGDFIFQWFPRGLAVGLPHAAAVVESAQLIAACEYADGVDALAVSTLDMLDAALRSVYIVKPEGRGGAPGTTRPCPTCGVMHLATS